MSSLLLFVALALFFGRTIYGKALRATAINRNGARLMGISPALAGKLTFFLAALQVADFAYVLETGEIAMEGPAHELADDARVIEANLGLGGKHQDKLAG